MPTPDPAPAGRDLDTRTLDREIAERDGWRSEQTTHGYRWRIRDNKWGSPQWYAHDSDLVFNYLYDKEIIPHYTADLNAAMTLTEPYAFKLTSVHSAKGRIGYIATIQDKHDQGGTGHADTPALAICYAWLAYTAATAGENGGR